ncbi:SagB/ThcOx family dehydrogenase (plasmid) [Borreliella valaisiana]|uniref:SagB/ThcOx family dehydrogenase n=1 Tax=Borreliella valaisiana TaxID=62088 RepID=UPI0027381081|nr:SagB/ThcOx family dehydrogenase [Borreliella valaisiana]WLN25767.1 SagB/ThcOx family dehydrogenase [Borreliella valaisiana]
MVKNDNESYEVFNMKLSGMYEINNVSRSVFNSNIIAIPSNIRIQASLFDKDAESLTLNYLLNFSEIKKFYFNENISKFLQDPAAIANISNREYREFDEDVVFLPKVKRLKIKLEDALLKRKSYRKFKNQYLNLVDLSTLLYYAAGDVRYDYVEFGNSKLRQSRKPYPSGGGMYPIDIYFYVNNVEKLDKGFYLYQSSNNSIVKINIGSIKIENLLTISFFEGSFNFNIAFFFVYRYEVNYLKYSEMSLSFAFIELGAIHQNFSLVSTALNLGYCSWGGFDKPELEKCLKLDGISEHVVSAAILGNV